MLHRKPSDDAESKRQGCTNDVTSKAPKERCQRPSLQAGMNENRDGKICEIIPAKGGPSRVQWGQHQASRQRMSQLLGRPSYIRGYSSVCKAVYPKNMPWNFFTYDSSAKSRVHVNLLIIDVVSEAKEGIPSTNTGVKAVKMATTRERSAVCKI